MVNNTKYGSDALQNNSGTNNTAIGAYASYNNLDAINNTSIGSNSAFYTTTGSNNTSLGAGSLCNNTTGALNTAIGSSALEGPLPTGSVGNQNTAIGAQALYTNQGDLNTSIGAYSALGLTGGSYNTFLGANTSATQPNFNYSTAIGYNATVDDSNQIMMGGNASGSYPNIVIPGKAFLPNFTTLSIENDQIVPKSYVDTVAAGLTPTQTCLCATTGNINLALTTAPLSSNTDGINFASFPDGNYNVLVVCQGAVTPSLTSNIQNGVYILSKTGSTYTWSRPVSPDPMSIGYDAVGAFSFVQGGTIYGKTGLIQIYKNTSNNLAIVGTDDLQYQTFFELNVSAGRGLDTQIINQQMYLNVDTSLNFINFLDSNTSDPSANGTLALGTNTNNIIVIGPTGTSVPIQAQSIIQAQKGITGATGSFTNLSASQQILAPAGITGTTGSFSYLNASQQISAPAGITGTTGSFSNLSASRQILAPAGITGATGSFSYLNASQQISAPAGITGTTGSFTNLSASRQILAPAGIIGATGSFSYLNASQQISAPAGITGATGTFSYLNASQQISAPAGITGSTGTFSYLNASQQISAPAGITGTTGSFTNLSASRQILAPAGITGATGSFSYLNASQQISAPAGITGTTGSFTNLSASRQILAPAGIIGATGSFSYLNASQQISAPAGITGATGTFSYLNASQQISAPAGITGSTGTFSYLNASQQISAPAGITGTTGSFTNLSASRQILAPAGITGATGSFSYLTASQQISAPAGITGATGSFSYLNASQQISAPAGITGATGSFSYLNASQQILAPAGITGATGSFSYLNASRQILAPAGITGATGSFSYLNASQQISAPAGITGTTGSFSYLNASRQILSPAGITGTTGSFSYLNASQQILAPAGITGTTGSFTNLSASRQILAPAGITGATGSFSYLNASQQISAPAGITGTTGSFSYLTANGQIVQSNSESNNIVQQNITTDGNQNILRTTDMFGTLRLKRPTSANGGDLRLYDVTGSTTNSSQYYQSGGGSAIKNLAPGGYIGITLQDICGNELDPLTLTQSSNQARVGINTTTPGQTLDVRGNCNIKTDKSTVGNNPTLTVVDNTSGNTIGFQPNASQSSINPFVDIGDQSIYSILPDSVGNTNLVLTTRSNTTSGVKVLPNQTVIGAGGNADIPTANMSFNATANFIQATAPAGMSVTGVPVNTATATFSVTGGNQSIALLPSIGGQGDYGPFHTLGAMEILGAGNGPGNGTLELSTWNNNISVGVRLTPTYTLIGAGGNSSNPSVRIEMNKTANLMELFYTDLSLQTSNLSNTAGASASLFLPISINGVVYKIALLNA
jgi:hypothetical protein